MLHENGREAFTDLSFENKDLIDFNRAKNEIALVDHEKNTVIWFRKSFVNHRKFFSKA
jgi:hypothetical protein